MKTTLTSIIKENEDNIRESILEAFRAILKSDCVVSYSLYIWEDGELQSHEHVGRPSGYLVPKEWETRKIFHLCDISEPAETLVYMYEGIGEDDEEGRAAAVEDCVNFFREERLDEIIEDIYTEAEQADSNQ